ncbi:DUF4097 family beta strand repeat-containing protein [Lactiplantibacillus daowaiensis]|uniref:DUF4097 family beta strand repeat-containing protein n=1 Tax=Lactiplantibacillus daowaiensis TaxID=2559918 RepID=A0ABW1RW54_9LACO|nr:DUF4097 family beta strand repeat-containing protein [Lactiplantibacillus daowaiensis]
MSEKIEQLVAMRLNTYFKNQPMTPALAELKTELATDLNEAANDKAQAGATPEAAVAEAFSDFGDINAVIAQVNADNGTTEAFHQHRMTMNDDGVQIDDGKTLKIDRDGVSLNEGRTFKADADGVSIGNGAIKADADGLKLGKLVMNDDGISFNGQPATQPDWGGPAQPMNLAGEYQDSLRLANEQRFAVADVQDLAISYRSARVKILPTVGGSDEIIVREYLQPNNSAYYAQITQQGPRLQVAQGKVPFLIPLRVHVQIHVPADFAGNLTVQSQSGTVLLAGLTQLGIVNLQVASGNCDLADLKAQALSADLKSGSLKLSRIQVADQFGMLVRSGRIRLASVTAGQFTVNATSGSIQGTGLVGGGSWNAHSGAIRLAFQRLTGDINLNAHSGAIKLATPADASYTYELESHSSRVIAPKRAVKDRIADGYQTGTVGTTAQVNIHGRAHSGSIQLY